MLSGIVNILSRSIADVLRRRGWESIISPTPAATTRRNVLQCSPLIKTSASRHFLGVAPSNSNLGLGVGPQPADVLGLRLNFTLKNLWHRQSAECYLLLHFVIGAKKRIMFSLRGVMMELFKLLTSGVEHPPRAVVSLVRQRGGQQHAVTIWRRRSNDPIKGMELYVASVRLNPQSSESAG